MRGPRVFLFDVHGTLITARGAGRRALGVALAETFGTTGPIESCRPDLLFPDFSDAAAALERLVRR